MTHNYWYFASKPSINKDVYATTGLYKKRKHLIAFIREREEILGKKENFIIHRVEMPKNK